MKPTGAVLRRGEYIVESIPLGMGRELIAAHHYARGASNTAVYRHGIFRPDNPLDCLGVALWLPPTRAAAESVHPDWRRVLSLSRLVIEPGMPTNAASFLLGQSIRLIRREGLWAALVTYADEGRGHTGGIYKATNWEYVGTRPGDPVYVDQDGRQVARKAGPVSRTAADMTALGYVNTGRTRKHKFVLYLEKASA